jgi:integrase
MNTHKKILSPKTSRRRLASLREFGNYAGQATLLPRFKLPSSGSTIPHPLPELEVDLQKLLDGCKTDMQRALIALLGLEGMRLHEALDIDVKDFDLNEMTIAVWGKGDKTRIIPITEKAWEYLAPRIISAMLANSPKLITYSDRGARTFITELGVSAGVSRPIASHDLRATFATLAYNHCQDIVLVQAWMGHSDVNTTQGYIGTKIEDMRKAGEF